MRKIKNKTVIGSWIFEHSSWFNSFVRPFHMFPYPYSFPLRFPTSLPKFLLIIQNTKKQWSMCYFSSKFHPSPGFLCSPNVTVLWLYTRLTSWSSFAPLILQDFRFTILIPVLNFIFENDIAEIYFSAALTNPYHSPLKLLKNLLASLSQKQSANGQVVMCESWILDANFRFLLQLYISTKEKGVWRTARA